MFAHAKTVTHACARRTYHVLEAVGVVLPQHGRELVVLEARPPLRSTALGDREEPQLHRSAHYPVQLLGVAPCTRRMQR